MFVVCSLFWHILAPPTTTDSERVLHVDENVSTDHRQTHIFHL